MNAHSIIIDNLAAVPQSHWVFVGLPAAHVPKIPAGYVEDTETGARHVYVAGDRCVRVKLKGIPPGRRKLVFVEDAEAKLEPFQLVADLAAMQPRWWIEGRLSDWPQLWAPGTQKPRDSYVRLIEQSDAHQTWYVRSLTPDRHLTHELWATVYSGQAEVEFVTTTIYGTTANDGVQTAEIDLPPMFLMSRAASVRDYARLDQVPMRSGLNADTTRPLPLTIGTTRLHRGRRIIARGTWNPNPGREVASLRAVWTGWDGQWFNGPVGPIPINGAAELAQDRAAFLGTGPGYWAARPHVQPKWSPTTGEQAGFGVGVLGRIVAAREAWFIDPMLHAMDAYALRPTGHREPNGDPMDPALHPLAFTSEGGVDARFSQGDLLGYAPPDRPQDVRTWWDGYLPSDDQHRCARDLQGMIALTGCPALRSILHDQESVMLLDYRYRQGWSNATRACGRLLLDWTGSIWLGHDRMRPVVERYLAAMETEEQIFRGGDQTHEIFHRGSLEQAKYGWVDANGKVVMGPQPWQDTILATQGYWQVWLVMGNELAKDRALRLARQTVERAFFQVGGTGPWFHVYAYNWGTRGAWPPASAYTGSSSDAMVVTPDADVWDLAACELIAAQEPTSDVGRKAQDVLAAYGPPKRSVDAQWRAVR